MPPIPGYTPRSERLAINLFDLKRVPPVLRGGVVKDLDLTTPVWIDRNEQDEHAFVFTCPLLKAAAMCDMLRNADRQANATPARVYICRATAWQRLPRAAVLTFRRDGHFHLSREVFPEDVELITEAAAPPLRVVVLGRLGTARGE